MKQNRIKIQWLFPITLCFVLVMNQMIVCAEIELKAIKHASLEKLTPDYFSHIIRQLEQDPLITIKTFTHVNKRMRETVFLILDQIRNMLDMAKKDRSKYNPINLRNHCLIRGLCSVDKSLFLSLLKGKRKKNATCWFVGTAINAEKSLTSIGKFINYFSYWKEISVQTLAALFGCTQYLKYYTFIYGDQFNLYMSNGPCILL